MRYKKKMKRGIKYHLKLRNKHAKGQKLKRKKLSLLYEKDFKGLSNFPTYAKRADKYIYASDIRVQMRNRSKEISEQIKKIENRIR